MYMYEYILLHMRYYITFHAIRQNILHQVSLNVYWMKSQVGKNN